MKKLVLLAAVLMIPVASADVLYDSLSIVDNQAYNAGNGDAISGMAVFGSISDLDACDDFTINQGYELDTVTRDYVTFLGGTPATGLLVEVFADLGGYPGETPVGSYMATGGEVSGSSWSDTIFGLLGRRLTATIPDGAIVLGPGTYYIDMLPVDTTANGDWYYTVRGAVSGSDSFGRDGYADHGNNYNGGYGSTNWVSFNSLGYGAGDISQQITGTVPEPASLALLGLGLVLLRRR